MKIYISGPIAGYENANKTAFDNAVNFISTMGETPVNPHDIAPHSHVGSCPQGYVSNGGHSSACWLRGDLKKLLECDAIFMINGWEYSIGARLEHEVATRCGLKIFYAVARWMDIDSRPTSHRMRDA